MPPLSKEAICARIKEARVSTGLSQQDLADKLHVSRNSIVDYERNRVPWDMLPQIAKVTERDWEWFLHGDQLLIDRDVLADILKRLERIEQRLDDLS